jgi:hypothetical protein
VHSATLEVMIHPLFLHEFWPLQLLLMFLQELWPLQLLPPTHFTDALELSCANNGWAANIAPTDAASTAPAPLVLSMLLSPFFRQRHCCSV